jgi:CRISPR/Cas system type I-B associated protein Csh2 (Cas7 group RAMP superfamily)
MLYKFTKDITCDDGMICSEKIKQDLISKFSNLKSSKEESNFTLTIRHEAKKHYIRISLCTIDKKEDKDELIFEIPQKNKKYVFNTRTKGVTSKTVTVDNPLIKKIEGTLPTEKEIKAVL